MELGRRDAARVRRMREMLELYRPGAPPVAEQLLGELQAAVDSEASVAMRPVLGELGWSFDFLYCTVDPSPLRAFATRLTTPWSPFFPVTPEPLRNRALRPKVVHADLVANPPTPEYRALLELVESIPEYGMKRDDLGVSVCDGEVVLAWFGTTRAAPFGPRELAVLDAIVPQLHARMLLEHQVGRAVTNHALLEVALEAIPAAAFIVSGTTIAHANATGRLLLDRDRPSVVSMLRESMQTADGAGRFTITRVDSAGGPATSLAVMRADPASKVGRRLLSFGAQHGLTARQIEVLSLVARGYANKTIAEHLSVSLGTVEEHVTQLLHKTGAGSRSELVARLWSP